MRKLLCIVCFLIIGEVHAQGFSLGEPHVVGLHTITNHHPDHEANNFNPGVYVKTDNNYLLGTYWNSHYRSTVYVGWATPEYYRTSLNLVLATGYREGLTFFIVPSVRVFTTDSGYSIKLAGGPALDPSGQTVIHLVVEKEF